MPLVKVIRHGQVTLPAEFRKELALEEGDYLAAELKDDCIILRPQVLLDRDEAVRDKQKRKKTIVKEPIDVVTGMFADDAALMDRIVEEAMKAREHHPLRQADG